MGGAFFVGIVLVLSSTQNADVKAAKTVKTVEINLANPEIVNSFHGSVVGEDLPDGRNRRLVNDFGYTDVFGVRWDAPKGTVWNGASIPRAIWSTGLSPFVGKYRDAAVIHDHYCKIKRRSYEETHLVFYEIMRARGTDPAQSRWMYNAVRWFGPRWSSNRISAGFTCEGSISVYRECYAEYEENYLDAIAMSLANGEIGEEEATEQLRKLAIRSKRVCEVQRRNSCGRTLSTRTVKSNDLTK